MILKIKYKTRYSKIDQENIKQIVEKWKDSGDFLYEPSIEGSVTGLVGELSSPIYYDETFESFELCMKIIVVTSQILFIIFVCTC